MADRPAQQDAGDLNSYSKGTDKQNLESGSASNHERTTTDAKLRANLLAQASSQSKSTASNSGKRTSKRRQWWLGPFSVSKTEEVREIGTYVERATATANRRVSIAVGIVIVLSIVIVYLWQPLFRSHANTDAGARRHPIPDSSRPSGMSADHNVDDQHPDSPALGDSPSQPKTKPSPASSVIRGSIDILVIRKDTNDSDIAVPLSDVRAWPLRSGDAVKIIANITPAAYLYVFWIDESGVTAPLYPWVPLRWNSRPSHEMPMDTLDLKDPNGNWFTISGARSGTETLVMLASRERLEISDEEIRGWFRDVKPLPFAGERSRIWFENFEIVAGDHTRTLEYANSMSPAGPRGLQTLLHARIGNRVSFSRSVSFSRIGPAGGK